MGNDQFRRSKLSVSCLYQIFHSFENILKFLFIENKRKKYSYEINYRTEINTIKEYWKNTILFVINRTNISEKRRETTIASPTFISIIFPALSGSTSSLLSSLGSTTKPNLYISFF